MRKTTTSTQVKNNWNAKTYARYQVNLRKDEDADLINFINTNKETHGTTELFRKGLELLIKEGLD